MIRKCFYSFLYVKKHIRAGSLYKKEIDDFGDTLITAVEGREVVITGLTGRRCPTCGEEYADAESAEKVEGIGKKFRKPAVVFKRKITKSGGREEDEINFSGRGWRWWKVREENVFNLPLENEQDIEMSLDPGLYVLSVNAWWKEKGSADYGFLVEVRTNEKEMI